MAGHQDPGDLLRKGRKNPRFKVSGHLVTNKTYVLHVPKKCKPNRKRQNSPFSNLVRSVKMCYIIIMTARHIQPYRLRLAFCLHILFKPNTKLTGGI